LKDSHHFAIVTRDESWLLDRRMMVESRLIHGSADQRGNTIDARDDLDEKLLALCDRESERVHDALAELGEGRARAVVSARNDGEVSSTISLSLRDLSVVTTLSNLAADHAFLLDLARATPTKDIDYRGVSLLWRYGSAAVLMHEAVGHSGRELTSDWLRVDVQHSTRQQSFSDVPLRRMTNVRVSCLEAGISLPPERYIEILLVAGGRYEPLTDRVSLSISAANLVDGDLTMRLRPFEIEEARATIERSLLAGGGDVHRYPGVICSSEGQNVFVGSYAPDLVTDFRR
jgi:hypothetical protein